MWYLVPYIIYSKAIAECVWICQRIMLTNYPSTSMYHQIKSAHFNAY